MGLKCLLGHDFGEVLMDRDRRERGNEVVVTIREYRECDRCGETRVVSENKEVRRASPTGSDAADEAGTTGTDPDATDASEAADGFDDRDVSAEEDDGVILEDEPDVREPGAWPEVDPNEAEEEEDVPAEPTPWPEAEGEDEGFSAEPSDGAELEGVQFGSGLTPEAATSDASEGSADPDDDVIESGGGTDRGGFRRASRSPSTGRQRIVEADTEFFCPECQHTTPTTGSSLRPGDICPNCRLGYLTERER